jgi:YegS/Rv2252/BmrU family lipid kinase
MLTFIVNPNSGGERGYKIWRDTERLLKKKQVQYRAFITNSPGDATAIAEKVTSGENTGEITVVAVGGDGTANEVIDGLHISENVTMGFIPTGSGNDLAAGLKLPGTPAGCLKRILHPKEIRRMDYGVLTYGEEGLRHRRFLNSSGAGYDAAVNVAIRDHSMKRRLAIFGIQKLSYFLCGAAEFMKCQTVKGYVVLDGVKKVEFNHIFFLSAHIHPTEGGGYRFAPKAEDTDGELTLCIVHSHSRRQIARILTSSVFGNHLKYEGVRSYNCRELKVHLEKAIYVHTDGEICGSQTDFEMRCIKGKLKFIC